MGIGTNTIHQLFGQGDGKPRTEVLTKRKKASTIGRTTRGYHAVRTEDFSSPMRDNSITTAELMSFDNLQHSPNSSSVSSLSSPKSLSTSYSYDIPYDGSTNSKSNLATQSHVAVTIENELSALINRGIELVQEVDFQQKTQQQNVKHKNHEAALLRNRIKKLEVENSRLLIELARFKSREYETKKKQTSPRQLWTCWFPSIDCDDDEQNYDNPLTMIQSADTSILQEEEEEEEEFEFHDDHRKSNVVGDKVLQLFSVVDST